jgi:hypothetical protein
VVAESVPEAKVIAAFFGKSHFSDGHDGIPEHLPELFHKWLTFHVE